MDGVTAPYGVRMGGILLLPAHPEATAYRLRLNELVADGVADEFGEGAEGELAHDRRPVRLDRLGADRQRRADRLVAPPLRQQPHDLPLPRRQHLARPRRPRA